MDPLSLARYGMMTAEARLSASAGRIAADGDVDYGHEAVEQIQAAQQFKASVGVARVADEMWRALLDVQAS